MNVEDYRRYKALYAALTNDETIFKNSPCFLAVYDAKIPINGIPRIPGMLNGARCLPLTTQGQTNRAISDAVEFFTSLPYRNEQHTITGVITQIYNPDQLHDQHADLAILLGAVSPQSTMNRTDAAYDLDTHVAGLMNKMAGTKLIHAQTNYALFGHASFAKEVGESALLQFLQARKFTR